MYMEGRTEKNEIKELSLRVFRIMGIVLRVRGEQQMSDIERK